MITSYNYFPLKVVIVFRVLAWDNIFWETVRALNVNRDMLFWLMCVIDMVVLTTFMVGLYKVWLIKMCKNSASFLTLTLVALICC